MNYLMSKFAKDRWCVLRLEHTGVKEGITLWTNIYMKNRYSGKLRREQWAGKWGFEDFPDSTFRN